jgi:hypothetical protein
MKMSRSRLAFFLAAVSSASCYWGYDESGPPPAQCFYATDCLAGFRCENGLCVLAPPYGGNAGSGATDASTDGPPYDRAPEDGPMDASRSECSIDSPPTLEDGATDGGCTMVADPPR